MLALLISLYLAPVNAQVLELEELSISVLRYANYSRYPLITQYDWRELDRGFNIGIKSVLFEFVYWNSNIFSMTDLDNTGWSQFRTVGLETSFGVHLTSFVDLGLRHRSEHLLDIGSQTRFPLLDAVEMTIYLYKKQEVKAILPW